MNRRNRRFGMLHGSFHNGNSHVKRTDGRQKRTDFGMGPIRPYNQISIGLLTAGKFQPPAFAFGIHGLKTAIPDDGSRLQRVQ